MSKPEIIGSSRSTYTRAVCMVCEEKGIDYVLTETPLHAPEIRAIHPFGKMPVLRHGDIELFESKAIVTWLDRSFPAPFVLPSEPRQAALTAGVTRFRPVLMTALAMIIGMIPMALGLGEGGEQNAPLGRAVIGGLVFATIATLLFVPTVFTLVHGRRSNP